MSGLAVNTQANVHADAAIEHTVFPDSDSGPFVSVKLKPRPGTVDGIALLIHDPHVLTMLADVVLAARADLVAALAPDSARDAA